MVDARPADTSDPTPPGAGSVPAVPPLTAYQRALERYEGARLAEIQRALGLDDPMTRPRAYAAQIAERLGDPRFATRTAAALDNAGRMALGLFALTECIAWSLNGLLHALNCLGTNPSPAVRQLIELGLVAAETIDGTPLGELARRFEPGGTGGVRILAHPGVVSVARTVVPEAPLAVHEGAVQRIRETDGLEAVLRLAAVWQRVDEAPVRRTQQGTLYKRDRDRLEDDPVLAGPIADALEPLPDMAALWLALARGVGLIRDEPENDRIVAASPGYWSENAIHLPQMIATRWLTLRTWHEQGGMQQEGSTAELATPYVRPAVLLWLATLPAESWTEVDALDACLRALDGQWDRAAFVEPAPESEPPRARGGRVRREGSRRSEAPAGSGLLESLLLGAAYQLGLVRGAEDATTGRLLVQLSPLGRYILALGPPPPPRPVFDHFLYVQPNFEVIAYRQGLSPSLIGQFSRFAHWSQVGAALELKLTAESVYRGLEGGLTPQEMLDRLARHSQRALPAGVAEALRTWAGRRERVTYYAAATLIEFATPADLEQALGQWPESQAVAPVAVSDRLLLVEDDASIPFQRFRLAGSRDYRRAPDACLETEADGVTLSLDLGRSDLMVDAELARFADELPLEPPRGAPGNPRRRFRVSAASLARGAENGMTATVLAPWYVRRTGAEMPPAVRLLIHASQARVSPLATSRLLVLQTPSADLLDGLLQHPDTSAHLGDRLGPTSVVIPDVSLEAFSRALAALGLSLGDPAEAAGRDARDSAAARRPGRSDSEEKGERSRPGAK